MSEFSMEKLHKVELLLAKELDRICTKYDLTYFMLAGTLLGAIRHKGFIPWDEDMDFGMMRDDYEKFLEVAPKELDPQIFFLQTMESDSHYPKAYAKLRLVNTHIKEYTMRQCPCMDGIFIDLFPMDFVPEDQNLQKKAQKQRFLWNAMLDFKCGNDAILNHKAMIRKTLRFTSHFFSRAHMVKKKEEIYGHSGDTPTSQIVTAQGSYGYFREIIPYRYTKEIVPYPFEDICLPGFKDYDGYLTSFYHDYMQIPPVSEQSKHTILKLDFGPYENDPRFKEAK